MVETEIRYGSYQNPETFRVNRPEQIDRGYISGREKKFLEIPRSLDEDITYLQRSWQKEKLPVNWQDLPEMGFLIGYQMKFLTSEKLGPGLSREEKKRLWIDKTKFDIQGWVREKPLGALLYPGRFDLQFADGQYRMQDSRHGANMDIADTLSDKERSGSVNKVYKDIVKPFLAHAPDGSILVVKSPSGPSGIPDDQGNMIIYEESHDEILRKRGYDVIDEFTIRTDLSDREHREILSRLRRRSGQSDPRLTAMSPVEDYVLNPALFDSSQTPITVQEIVDVMRNVRQELSHVDYAYKAKTWDAEKKRWKPEFKSWDEIYSSIKTMEKGFAEGDEESSALYHYDDVSDRYIDEFVELALREESQERIKLALATTILRLSKYVTEKEEKKHEEKMQRLLPGSVPFRVGREYPIYKRDEDGLGDIMKRMQELPGCASGSGRKTVTNAVLGGVVNENGQIVGSSPTTEWYECPCGYKATGPIGNVKVCPGGCGRKREDSLCVQ